VKDEAGKSAKYGRRTALLHIIATSRLHPVHRHSAARVRQMLQLQAPPKPDPLQDPGVPPPVPPDAEVAPPIEPMICPHCHQGRLIFIRRLSRQQAMGP
jgi:hypothetical protein